ncbi:hypothetical protein LAJ19_16485 (plasmid) [Deinococcus taeanensis]|uniref:hypothetical protein n=1 Tax=Deinococcus taeanensis TaxID=2737050 RepID=UPI001CDD1AAF|nr:hypothetical protein [Deinococcus taeanensis]UBV44749.1 hypothetical protein LAJ19_16485 [Deinococcus taeanensis]
MRVHQLLYNSGYLQRATHSRKAVPLQNDPSPQSTLFKGRLNNGPHGLKQRGTIHGLTFPAHTSRKVDSLMVFRNLVTIIKR